MYVINRKNQREAIRYDKINDRNIELSKGLNVDPSYLSKLVIESLKSGMTTTEIDELSAETAFYMSTYEPDYDILATRISVSNLHKQTSSSFYETVKKMYDYIDEKSGKKSNVISDDFMKFVEENKVELDNMIDYSTDFNYNYFGFKTLTRMYLNKLNGVIVERPQHMLMRVAVCIHLNDIDSIRESYKEMSLGKFTHASPTLFNSGSARPQLASCFLLKCEDDLEHIYETNKRSALISKHGGGIGIDITNVRSKGSVIHSTNGNSDGLVPMCKVFNASANYCNQSGKRKGSIAMYLQPWHPDVFEFLALRYNNPPEELRARDLFTAMWIPDIFMRRVERDEMWSLFDPNVVRGLCDTYGEEFDKIYEEAEREKKYVKRIKARDVWKEIIHSQQETGLPYVCYKDSINRKSNQKNIGIIRSSNLCAEVTEFTDTNSISTCLTADTMILTKEGMKHIIDCNNVDILVPMEDDNIFNRINNTYEKAKLIHNGKQEVFEIDLIGYKPIKATSTHKFLTITKTKKYIWKTVIELGLDDRIVIGKNDTLLNYDIDIEHCIDNGFLCAGWCLGDGWYVKRNSGRETFGVCFGPSDTFARDIVIEELNKIHNSTEVLEGGHEKNIKLYEDKNGVWNWATSKTKMLDYMKETYGFTVGRGPTKRISPIIFKETPNKIASYLCGLFSSDGCLVLTKNKPPSISFSSSSKELLYDIQTLLQCFGIHGRVVWSENVKGRNTSQGNLSIFGVTNLTKFNKHISFYLCPIKQEKLKLAVSTMKNGRLYETRDWISIRNIVQLPEEDVYDLSLPNKHNFIANGIISHNCNLASLSLPSFVKEREVDGEIKKYYDFNELGRITKIAVRNLNKVIDRTYYPVKEAQTNNLSYRPIGLGIQGLADVFAMFEVPWDSSLSKALNQLIMEVVYYYALEASHEFSIEMRKSYDAFEGSPISKGEFQFDMWNVVPMTLKGQKIFGETLKLNWEELREKCKKGMANSLLVALMPTASSSQILGNNECFENYTSNIYTRSTISGDFIMVNKHLARHLKELKLWDKEMVNKIIENNGSVQSIKEIPIHVRDIYRTVWEISQKVVIDFAADRGAFVDQSQSMNIFIEQPSYAKLSSMHLYGWKKGLKTGSYYIRSKPSRDAVKFSILRDNGEKKENEVEEKKEGKKYMLNGKEMICTEDVCVACSS